MVLHEVVQVYNSILQNNGKERLRNHFKYLKKLAIPLLFFRFPKPNYNPTPIFYHWCTIIVLTNVIYEKTNYICNCYIPRWYYMARANKTAILWFRNDLRIHDNEALHDALEAAENVIPAYIFDPRVFFAKTKFGFPKVGKYRAKFIIESVQDLKTNLQKLGSDLYVRIGNPEDEIFELSIVAAYSAGASRVELVHNLINKNNSIGCICDR